MCHIFRSLSVGISFSCSDYGNIIETDRKNQYFRGSISNQLGAKGVGQAASELPQFQFKMFALICN